MLNPIVDSVSAAIPNAITSKFFAKVGTHIKLLDPTGIVYAQASGDYIGIVLTGGRTLHTRETMGHLESRLLKDEPKVMIEIDRLLITALSGGAAKPDSPE